MKKLLMPALIVFAATALASERYEFLTQISIGGEGGWDIVTIDSAARRLFLAQSTRVVVVDLTKNSSVAEIADTPGVHAFLPVAQFQRGFSSNGRDSTASVVDLATFKTIRKLPTGEGPDEIVFEPLHGEVYVLNHKGNSATVIDAKLATVTATIPLGGSPEFAAADSLAHRVYCNLEDKNEVVAINTDDHEVVAHWPVAPGEAPGGMALDVARHRLFVGCHNKLMVMLDTTNGKVVASVQIGAGLDGCAYDDATQLAFASCGDGTATIAKLETPQKLTLIETLKTERGARTMALDPQTHRIYLPTAEFGPPASPSPGASPGRPTIVPNTLKLLVYAPRETSKH